MFELTPILFGDEGLHGLDLGLGQLNTVEEILGFVRPMGEELKVLDRRVFLGVTERNDLPIVRSLMDVPSGTGNVDGVLNPLFHHPTDGTFGVVNVDDTVSTDHFDGPDVGVSGLPHLDLSGGNEGDEPDLGSQFTEELWEVRLTDLCCSVFFHTTRTR